MARTKITPSKVSEAGERGAAEPDVERTERGVERTESRSSGLLPAALPAWAGNVRGYVVRIPALARTGGRQARGSLDAARHTLGSPVHKARHVVGESVGAARQVVREVPGNQLALYAGLGAAAAFSVIEWPVAVAVAVGSELARRTAAKRPEPAETKRPETPETSTATEGSKRRARRSPARSRTASDERQ
jgi:hypothetical protein